MRTRWSGTVTQDAELIKLRRRLKLILSSLAVMMWRKTEQKKRCDLHATTLSFNKKNETKGAMLRQITGCSFTERFFQINHAPSGQERTHGAITYGIFFHLSYCESRNVGALKTTHTTFGLFTYACSLHVNLDNVIKPLKQLRVGVGDLVFHNPKN